MLVEAVELLETVTFSTFSSSGLQPKIRAKTARNFDPNTQNKKKLIPEFKAVDRDESSVK